MRGSRFVVAAWLLAGFVSPGAAEQFGVAPPGGAEQDVGAVEGPEIQAVLARYCQACHNQRSTVGRETGLAFDALDVGAIAGDAERWEHVVRRLRNGSMPPAGRSRPAADTYDRVAAWIESRLDAAAEADPDPGRPAVLHRLNRAEYRNAVRDLLALDVDVSSLLPPDTSSYGFDNIGDVLGLSPLLLESYLAAANRISRLAVASDSGVAVTADVYRVSTELTQRDRLDGLPFGTRGGTLVEHFFPVDGEYEIRVRLARNGASGNGGDIVGLNEPHRVEIAVDGARAGLLTVGANLAAEDSDWSAGPQEAADANLRVRVPVQAGPRRLAVSFLRRPSAQVERVRRPFLRALLEHDRTHDLPYVSEVIVTGPYRSAAPVSTPSRDRIFTCRPEAGAAAERACAGEILSALARRAFRRPIDANDLGVLLPFYEAGRREGGFERGIEQALARLLVSPSFLFRIELDPVDAASGRAYPVEDLSLASRLSFFLWSSLPDDELIELADRGGLSDPDVLERQVRRMLADPRADALADNFAGQWLYLRNVPAARPDFRRFPNVDDNLRHAFRRETELLFHSIVREDRSVIDLLAADYTFRQRALGAALRHPVRLRRPLPAREHCRPSDAGRPPGAGQHAHRAVAVDPHVAGEARHLDSREHPRDDAARPAAGRAGAGGERERRPRDHDAGGDGAAPRQPDVRGVPPVDGPAGAGAGELRRGRPLAREGRVGRAAGRFGRASRRHALHGGRGAEAGIAGEPGAVPADADGEAADLCPGARPGVHGRSRGAAHRARRRVRGASFFGAGARHRQERAVPAAAVGRCCSGSGRLTARSLHRERRRPPGEGWLGGKRSRGRRFAGWKNQERGARGGIMLITKRALPRRTFLRGAGAALALPLLDAMVPAASALSRTAADPVRRLGFVYFPNGANMFQWQSKGEGKAFELSPTLAPLGPFRDAVTVLSGLDNDPAKTRGATASATTRAPVPRG